MTKFLWHTQGNSAGVKQAIEISNEIASFYKLDESTTKSYKPQCSPVTLRQYIRSEVRKNGWADRVNTAIDGDRVWVHVKEVSREKILERLIEKMMMETENELLYEEAMEVLYGNGQK